MCWSQLSDGQVLAVLDTLSKLSHDTDREVAYAAIFSLGLVSAGAYHAPCYV